MSPRLNLIVLRAHDIARLADFYTLLGLTFARHRHGSGPEHYSSVNEGQVFEIYPLGSSAAPTHGLRLGFSVSDLPATLDRLVAAGAEVLSPSMNSPSGRHVVVRDSEGHKIELQETK